MDPNLHPSGHIFINSDEYNRQIPGMSGPDNSFTSRV